MIKKIDTKIEIQQEKEPNFGPLFDGEDSSQVKLMSDEQEPGTVFEVYQKGFQLKDRLLRPALVAVTGSAEKSESE